MQTRICWRCKNEKSLEEFPNDKNRPLGKSYICALCEKQRRKEYATTESRKIYLERSRESRNALHKKYRQSKKGKIVSIRKAKKMKEKYPEKWRARAKLRYEVKMGRVEKLPCEVCGEPKVHGHHYDYSKPLDVKWLCDTHHKEEHLHN